MRRSVTCDLVLGYKRQAKMPLDHQMINGMEDLRRQLEELRSEHRDLDEVIARLSDHAPFDQLTLQRLKKRKLLIKDQVAQLESKLLPDIIA